MTEAWDVGIIAVGGCMGLITGYVGGVVGAAGASLQIALLVFVCGMDQQMATGTVRILANRTCSPHVFFFLAGTDNDARSNDSTGLHRHVTRWP
jgi:hypothetical protein